MLSKKTDNLLSELNNISKYDYINEAFDINTIASRLNSLKDSLLSSNLFTNNKFRPEELELIKKARMASVDESIRVVTYPNIHYDQKYKINASVIIDFVLKKINDHAKSNSKPFNVTETVQEGISFALKYLIGKTSSRYLTLGDFKNEYQLYAFGSYRKVEMYPKIFTLITLVNRSPSTISFIENNLMRQQINNINTYAKKIENDFVKLLQNKPDLKYILSSYMDCIERSIRALVNMYKIIRNTFIELQKEYFNVFRQIVRIDESRTIRLYNESSMITNDYIKFLNENILNIESLNENTITDKYEFEIDLNNEIKNTFNMMLNKKTDISSKIKNDVFKSLELVSKIDPYKEYELNIPNTLIDIPNINIKKYIDSLNDITNSCENINELVLKSSEIIFNDNIKFSNINKLRKYMSKLILGETGLKTFNFDILVKNILVFINCITYIENNYYNKINEYLKLRNEKNINFIKNIIIGYMSIIDTIYFNILSLIQYFINIILIIIN